MYCILSFIIFFFFRYSLDSRNLPSFPTRRSSDLHPRPAGPVSADERRRVDRPVVSAVLRQPCRRRRRHGCRKTAETTGRRSEEHTSELQSRSDLVCRLLLEKKKKKKKK